MDITFEHPDAPVDIFRLPRVNKRPGEPHQGSHSFVLHFELLYKQYSAIDFVYSDSGGSAHNPGTSAIAEPLR